MLGQAAVLGHAAIHVRQRQVGRCGLRAPVYMTSAAHKMGQLELYDQFLSRRADADFDAWDLDDVDAAFAAATPVKFQQRLALTGALRAA